MCIANAQALQNHFSFPVCAAGGKPCIVVGFIERNLFVVGRLVQMLDYWSTWNFLSDVKKSKEEIGIFGQGKQVAASFADLVH